ncbi:PPOX class F420-dependent oxidoreductase [Aldersonia kunmingensis]|uniref:PPOX class F420-dependent oxidoreductase n=1 Tax=Aldersonia kunmingensis TaxID=408066 RepID=UPI00082A76EB|nr:PPOX class F420-dependent oxidoreductase [Aldersonia kunmingensis]
MTFTDAELDYLSSQRLGRMATAQPDGTLQVSPVGFRYNEGTKTIDIAGHNMARSKKFRNVSDNGRVAFVVDDLASIDPWTPRFLEIRGHAEAIARPTDSAYGDRAGGFDGAIIRVHPERLISYGIEAAPDMQGRNISTRNVD